MDLALNESSYVCFACIDENCSGCKDVMAVVFGSPLECNCLLPGHTGEPVNNQILDPFTHSVHTPGLVVEESGEVRRNG